MNCIYNTRLPQSTRSRAVTSQSQRIYPNQIKDSQQLCPSRTQSSVVCRVAPFDTAWNPSTSASSIAPTIFALSIFPYAAFLYFITRVRSTPRLSLFGFYFLLVFVGVSIPAGIIAKTQFGTSLSNVDYLHGGAESLLTLTNLMLVIGFRQALMPLQSGDEQEASVEASDTTSATEKADATSEDN